MNIRPDRLREIADGAMGIGAPLVLTQAEQVAVCTELLACREEREKHITSMAAIAQRHLDAAAERDAARFEAESLRTEKDMAEGEADAALDGEWFADLCDAIGRIRAQRDAASAEAASLRQEGMQIRVSLEADVRAATDELAAVKRQRDELVKAVLSAEALRIKSDLLPDVAYDQMDQEIEAAGSELVRIAKALAAEQPKPQQPEVQP